jgi:hypothetical protein
MAYTYINIIHSDGLKRRRENGNSMRTARTTITRLMTRQRNAHRLADKPISLCTPGYRRNTFITSARAESYPGHLIERGMIAVGLWVMYNKPTRLSP